ncbi:MAG: TRAP transporter fused permease subunit, partial [Chloroflexota bacterium]
GSGIYGLPLSVSANYIFLFLLFGGLLQMSGATNFFMEVAKLVSRRLRGGPAQMAIISSAMCATVTGSAMANVMITGSFTIPAMKKIGFEPATAGAVEAVASTGGLITPPVMGATAFIMSALTGIPYVQIMAAAALPALFYYLSCFIYVELYARKLNLPPMSADINRNTVIRGAPAFFIPMAVIVALLVMGFSPIHTAAWAVISTFAVFVVTNAITRDIPVRRQFRLLLDGTVDGANSGAGIAVVCAVLGLMMGMLTMTGMGVQITRIVADWSHGMLFLAAFITMIVCLFLGCIVVGTVGYVLTAILAAPVLLKMGVSPLQVHMFLLFYTAYASFTPPVATAAIAAAAISGAPYLKVGIRSWTIASGLFTFPFIFLWNQTLFLKAPDPLTGTLTILALIVGLVALNMATTGYSLGRIGWRTRLLFALCFAGFFAYTIILNYLFLGAATVLLALLILWRWSEARERAKLVAEVGS